MIAGTIIFAPGINDATVDTIGFEATSDTTFHALLATLVTVLTTPLTTFLIPLNKPPKKNSGNLPPFSRPKNPRPNKPFFLGLSFL